jgi:F420-dependent methylenetetrahydromethanopterin dehydrogenase
MAYGRPILLCYRGVGLTPIGGADIHILVALEDDYRAYRETIAAVLRVLRPHAEVKSTTLEALEDELERFDPQVVICGGHEGAEPDGRPAWIELSLDPTQPTKISVGGRYLERTDPSVEELLDVIDEVVIDEVRVTHRNKLC